MLCMPASAAAARPSWAGAMESSDATLVTGKLLDSSEGEGEGEREIER